LDVMAKETIGYVFKVASDHKIDLRKALSLPSGVRAVPLSTPG
jgi:hypothetical protein